MIGPQARVLEGDRAGVALAARVVRDEAHRAGAIERADRDDVVELGRADLLERLAHALRLELEDADRVAAGEHLVGLCVVERDRRHVDLDVARALDDRHRVLDHVEVAKAQEVHLQEADLLDRAHRVLGHDLVLALRPPALAVRAVGAAVLGELKRHDLVERAVRDHHRGGVDRVVADDAFEALRDVHDPLRVRAGVDLAAQVGVRLQALLEAGAAAHDRLGDELCEAVARAVVVAEDPRCVAGCGARSHLAEGDDLRDGLAAVLLLDVADHALAPADREVDVDVRHGLSRRVEEALEEEVVGERVEVRDVEAVGDDRACRRAAARARRRPRCSSRMRRSPRRSGSTTRSPCRR